MQRLSWIFQEDPVWSKGPYKRDWKVRVTEGQVTEEAEVRETKKEMWRCLWKCRRSQETKHTGGLQTLEKTGNKFAPRAFRSHMTADTSILGFLPTNYTTKGVIIFYNSNRNLDHHMSDAIFMLFSPLLHIWITVLNQTETHFELLGV